MLKELQKALGLGKPEAAKPAEATESLAITVDTTAIQAAIDAAVTELRVEFDAFKETAEGMVASLSEELTATKTALEAAQAALGAAEAKEAELVATAETKRLAARKELVVAAVGTERADALLTATEGLDEAAFSAVVSALGVSATVEAASPLFTEVGVTAEADTASVVAESKEMSILKKKYAKK